jgi:hypothetical protein
MAARWQVSHQWRLREVMAAAGTCPGCGASGRYAANRDRD